MSACIRVYLELNDWFPRSNADTKVVSSTTDLCDSIANTVLKQAERVLDDAAAFHTAIHMLNSHAAGGELLVKGFLLVRQCTTTRFLKGRDRCNTIQGKRQKAEILQSLAS